jgi:hypothetical protein
MEKAAVQTELLKQDRAAFEVRQGSAAAIARRIAASGTFLLCAAALSGPASSASLESRLDQFVVYRNGSVWVNDTFSDGLTPPSGQGTIGQNGGPLTYFTQGGFSEAGGKVIMASETHGLPVFLNLVNANTGATILTDTELTRVHTARVLSSTSQDPSNMGGLKKDHHAFEVLALYDLVPPTTRTNNYGIGLVDNFGGSGPTRDRMRLSVTNSTTTGALRVAFWRNDDTTTPSQNFNFGSHALDTGHDQIVLRLSRPATASNEIVASYAYVDGPNVGIDLADPANVASLSFSSIANTTAEPNTIFNDFIHTRAEFRQLARDEDNRFDFARLTTGSPVSISQEVTTGGDPSYLTFNYRFETTTGVLSVKLGDTVLGTINAPAVVDDGFLSASFLVDAGLLGQTLPLALELDGPTGSKILLDSIGFAGLVNANFATGDLTGWNIMASGTGGAGVLTVVAIPEPETYVLMLLGLAAVGFAARRRAGRPAAILA